MPNFTRKQLEKMLKEEFDIDPLNPNGEGPQEDLAIVQPDGSRACVGWELAGQGYQIIDPKKEEKRRYKN
jgi:hypothetical protein